MARFRKGAWRAVFVVAALALSVARGAGQAGSGRAEIEAFNKKFIAAHLRMDTPAVLSMWAEDGVSLLPETAPLVGKQAIAKFVADVLAHMPGYRVTKEEIEIQNIQLSGDWAYEWGLEHQVVEPPDGKPAMEGRGKILLILHKDGQGEWKIKQEMWNSAPKA
jgi:uncharacterized protein (TIGR02246 family)